MPGNMKIRASILECIIIIFLLISIVSANIYSINITYKESNLVIKKMFPAKVMYEELLTSIINQEIGIRAYTISKDKKFLDSYYSTSMQIQSYFDNMNELSTEGIDNNIPNEIKSETNSIKKLFDNEIELDNNGNFDEAKSNFYYMKNLIDVLRKHYNLMILKIDRTIGSSNEKINEMYIVLKHITTIFGFVTVFISIISLKRRCNKISKKESKIDRRLQKSLDSQEEFITNISHELKTPLNVIYSTIQLFELYCIRGSLDEKKEIIQKYIRSMKINSFRLSRLINNIVDSSKIESGYFKLNLSNNNIVEVVEKVVISVMDYVKYKELNIIFDTDVEEKFIAFDLEEIERVILNLISNAIKFSDKSNKIFVTVKDGNDFLKISVEDSGIGITKDDINIIFDRFKQVDKSLSRSAEGSGMGLSLSKAIVELHGGKIGVESIIGKGSIFYFTLPVRKINQKNILRKKLDSKNNHIILELSDIY